jgi:hypothetical protein
MTDTTPGGWPDAARPGYPLNPERDGWHWLLWADETTRPCPRLWSASQNGWVVWSTGGIAFPSEAIIYCQIYIGPCHTPAEVEARIEAARREGAAKEREAIAQMHDIWADRHHPDTIAHTRHKFCAAAIRARGDA